MRVAAAIRVGLAVTLGSMLLTLWARTGRMPFTLPVSPESTPTPHTRRVDTPPCPDADRTRRRADALELQVRTARARLATLQAERSAIAGEPTPWPEDPDLTPEAAVDALTSAAEQSGVHVVEVDCEEDPCIAMVAFHIPADAPQAEVSNHFQRDFVRAFRPVGMRINSQMTPHPDGGYTLSLVGPIRPIGADSPTHTNRETFRTQALARLVHAEVKSGDREPVPITRWPPEPPDDEP